MEKYLIITKFNHAHGDLKIDEFDNEEEAIKIYKNQSGKVGIWAEKCTVIKGEILHQTIEKFQPHGLERLSENFKEIV